VVLQENDLIPEGTAYNTQSKSIYIGSIYRQKIIEITSDDIVSDLFTREDFGTLSPIGMEVDNHNRRLWVNVALGPIVNQTKLSYWRTGIMSFDLDKKTKIKYYELNFNSQSFLNDITLDRDGNVCH
jgi:hypothetical protein